MGQTDISVLFVPSNDKKKRDSLSFGHLEGQMLHLKDTVSVCFFKIILR